MGVSRGVYYHYERYRRNQPADVHHRQLLEAVLIIAKSCDYTYGSRRMKREVG
jgi:hypothetical protein